MTKYIFRLDDICPTMNWQKFERIKNLFFEYGVKPIIAVIPDNQDQTLRKNTDINGMARILTGVRGNFRENLSDIRDIPSFWQKIKELENRGWTIAMHGYQHKYTQENGGILKIHTKSEFAGLPYQEQFEKIKTGKEILENHGIKTDIFIAPGHSFDENTLKALEENNFNIISDGIALYPFKKYDILWVPQIAWTPSSAPNRISRILNRISRKLPRKSANICVFPSPIITFCLHPNTMQENDFCNLENFIKNHQNNIINFEYAINWHKRKNLINKIMLTPINFIFRQFWYLRRKIR